MIEIALDLEELRTLQTLLKTEITELNGEALRVGFDNAKSIRIHLKKLIDIQNYFGGILKEYDEDDEEDV